MITELNILFLIISRLEPELCGNSQMETIPSYIPVWIPSMKAEKQEAELNYAGQQATSCASQNHHGSEYQTACAGKGKRDQAVNGGLYLYQDSLWK